MNNTNYKTIEEIYNNHLNEIQGIKFTLREIDVIAGILYNRGEKKIASILSISPRTIGTHVYNIMTKLGVNSKENIIDFIEKSDKLQYFKYYYPQILIQATFENKLQKIRSLVNKERIVVTIHDNVIKEKKKYLFDRLVKHLELANIFIKPISNKEQAKFSLHIFTENELTLQDAGEIIFLLIDKNINLPTTNKIDYIDFREEENYYLSTICLLEKIINRPALNTYFQEFKDEYEKIKGSWGLGSLESPENENNIVTLKQSETRTKKTLLKILLPIILLTISLVIIYPLFKDLNIEFYNKQASVRSNLLLPHDSVLLKRAEIIAEMKKKLGVNKGIQAIALVGIGGAGKTTLARNFAQSQDMAIVWEINAETETGIINSFEQLAYATSRTEKERQELRILKEINDPKERKDKLFLLLAKLLKTYPNWLITYDNVETFQSIQKYFLNDPKVWGNGKIIITTRNSNIANNSYINPDNVIFINELKEKEKFELFSKILGKDISLLPQEKAKTFLKEIPSFPLDVSIAAYYIKGEKISYDKYLEYIANDEESFATAQEKIFKNADQYDKTRYKIITLSIKKILEENPDFAELFLFISMLDSQNIPKDLLTANKNEILTHSFILNLKKFSLVTEGAFDAQYSISTISIHRSTQAIILAYFNKQLNLVTPDLLESIATILQKYMEQEGVNKYEFEKIRLLVVHSEMFLSHALKLRKTTRTNIANILGNYYFYLGDFNKAQILLEDGLIIFKQLYGEKNDKIIEVLIDLGNIYRIKGDSKKGVNLLEEALAICRQYYGEDNAKTARILMHLGHANIYNYKKAITYLEQAYNIFKKLPAEDNIQISWTLIYLGLAYLEIGDYKTALNFFERIWKINKNYYGEEHIKTAGTMIYLGKVYKDLGDYKTALNFLKKGWKINKDYYGEDNLRTIWPSIYIGSVYKNIGEYQKALKFLEQGSKFYNNQFGEDHFETAWTRFHLGKLYIRIENYDGAKQLINQSLKSYKNFYGINHVNTARVLISLGQVNLLEGNIEVAENLINQALEIFKQNNHPNIYTCFESLADIYLKKQKQEVDVNSKPQYKSKVCEYLIQADSIIKPLFPNNSAHLKRILDKLSINKCLIP